MCKIDRAEKWILKAPPHIRFFVALPITIFMFFYFGIGAILEGLAECLDKILDKLADMDFCYRIRGQHRSL